MKALRNVNSREAAAAAVSFFDVQGVIGQPGTGKSMTRRSDPELKDRLSKRLDGILPLACPL
ncbi:hypothetical protein D3H55_10300 [Bacillus salacetis]|uniref:Uncharacterized protein n=1 Tax=Bacillus salacetis TaxID=2315464 RepID=A0A3A1R333_9BACI|nr:hypothetical protein D3H55_10300 [Bacillus salacetis]